MDGHASRQVEDPGALEPEQVVTAWQPAVITGAGQRREVDVIGVERRQG
jgi:hypothetical protein